VVLTEEDKKDWGNLPNITAIPNPVTFVPNSISDCEAKRAIALGRICKQKQYDVMLKIWQKVVEKNPDWKLSIFANGGNPEDLKNLAKELKIENNFEVYPTTKEVEKELVKSSIYLMTSKYEGFPLVLLEAMRCGLPVVSFACKCGPKDMINNGIDGFLVEPGNEKDFEEKINFLIENENSRKQMGKAASENIQRFSEEKVMQKWMDLFNKLTSK
jgi:glycosyltransferase involved in cell wall biosynthesis